MVWVSGMDTTAKVPGDATKKPYHRPQLRRFGPVAELTAGGSNGAVETQMSADPSAKKRP